MLYFTHWNKYIEKECHYLMVIDKLYYIIVYRYYTLTLFYQQVFPHIPFYNYMYNCFTPTCNLARSLLVANNILGKFIFFSTFLH